MHYAECSRISRLRGLLPLAEHWPRMPAGLAIPAGNIAKRLWVSTTRPATQFTNYSELRQETPTCFHFFFGGA